MSSDHRANGVFLDDLEHFREMVEKLRRYRRAVPPEELAPHIAERRRYIADLIAVAFCLRATGNTDIARSFGELAGHLSDLDKGGRPDPVLSPVARKGRSIDSREFWEGRSDVSLGLQCLISAKQPEEQEEQAARDAAQYAADNYPELKKLVVVRKNSPKRQVVVHEDNLAGPIMSWYEAFREGTAGDVQVQKAFTSNHRLLLQDLKARSIENRKLLADKLLSAAELRAGALDH